MIHTEQKTYNEYHLQCNYCGRISSVGSSDIDAVISNLQEQGWFVHRADTSIVSCVDALCPECKKRILIVQLNTMIQTVKEES